MDNTQNTREYNKGLVEALIFLSGEPVKLGTLADSIKLEKSYVRDLVEELILDYSERNGGFLLKEIAGGYQFLTNEAYYKVLGGIFKERKRE
ncbi:MAG TPA: SMC-Scp complex subunit ScpB, partial [Leptospiraceae bacterium]|nr:SMC-Scp complex subunit ScpB [Leptospiraceae bacterium]